MKRDDIDQISLDREIKLQEPVEKYESDPSNSEWTYGLQKVGVPEVRKAYGLTGKGIRVGILDTGIDPEHPDLKGKVIAWKDFAGWAKNPKTQVVTEPIAQVPLLEVMQADSLLV